MHWSFVYDLEGKRRHSYIFDFDFSYKTPTVENQIVTEG